MQAIEHRRLGSSGLVVPALSFGVGMFGAREPMRSALGGVDEDEARRLIDVCLDAGVTLFDTADVYGASQSVLGAAIKGRREKVMISTKTTLPVGDGPHDAGSSRPRLISACENALRALGTDYVDLFQLHAFDAHTPVEEVLSTLDDLVRSGKVRYVGVSNFAGWQLMKSLAVADRYGYPRYVVHEVYYSLVGRDYEWELMPLADDQGVGALVWSPLAWGRLTGKLRRGSPATEGRAAGPAALAGPPADDELLFDVIDAIDEVAKETGRSIPQIAINWLLRRPTVASVIIGARNEKQLRENLGAVGWSLSEEQVAKLDQASEVTAPYPYQNARRVEAFGRLDPPLVGAPKSSIPWMTDDAEDSGSPPEGP